MKITLRQRLPKINNRFGSLFFGIGCLWLFTMSAAAATFQVTNTADNGAGSLRQAVADANATTAADTINFSIPATDANCNTNGVCTITLTSGVITVQTAGGALTIANQTGAGRLLISGNNASRVFESLEGGNLTLDGLTVTRGVSSGFMGGNAFGVVRNFRGTLTIVNSIFNQNSGGYIISTDAFGNSGVLNVGNTTVSNNAGAGIFFTNSFTNGGTANIVNSTINNNTVTGSGGGVYFFGSQLAMVNSTISGNSGSQGGGIYAIASQGGSPAATSLVLTSCTVTGNSATQGGGGIHVFQSTIRLRNTIVAGNTSSSGTPDFNFQSSGAQSLGNNLIGNATNTGGTTQQWLASDILNRDARLAPLDDNGGATRTHALLPDSPAINAGNNCVLTANGCGDNNPAVPLDQRGRTRAGAVDIGAFEFGVRTQFDFDGDDKADIAVFRPSNGTWYVLPSRNNSFYGFPFGQAGDRLAPADYDGDRRTDIAVWRETVPGAGDRAFFYILNSADNSFRPVQFGTQGDVPLPGDWDGDGRADLAVYRAPTAAGGRGNFYYRPSSQPTVDFVTIPFGSIGDKPLLGDFDGDRRLDPAVFSPSSASWNILFSTTNLSGVYSFGVSTDIPVPADYDGDGLTNIAVFRPSNGTWYTSINPANNFGAVQFGASSDLPVAADYDGDGRADVAVFRPSNGVWYLNRTSSGFLGVQFGQNGDNPIPNAFVR